MRWMFRYAGPKPVCSDHGVSFLNNKEDKYIYLDTLVQLIEALDRQKMSEGHLHFTLQEHAFSPDVLYEKINHLYKDLPEFIKKVVQESERYIKEEKEKIAQNPALSKVQKEVWHKNIDAMHDYLIQRQLNKAIYERLIKRLAERLHEVPITHLVVPLDRNFEHLLKSIENALMYQKNPIDLSIHASPTAEGPVLHIDFKRP